MTDQHKGGTAKPTPGGPIGPPGVGAPAPEDVAAGKREDRETFAKADLAIQRKRKKLLNDRIEIGNVQRVWNNRMRLVAACGIFLVVLGWLIAVLLLVALQACPRAVKLTDSVLIALLVASSVNVIGLLRIVAVYLFPRPTSRSP